MFIILFIHYVCIIIYSSVFFIIKDEKHLVCEYSDSIIMIIFIMYITTCMLLLIINENVINYV